LYTSSLHRTPPPPTSTPFPYTTLFRSPRRSSDAPIAVQTPLATLKPPSTGMTAPVTNAAASLHSHCTAPSSRWTGASAWRAVSRSEEHTSELQSLAYLVCRLLLEKKNK